MVVEACLNTTCTHKPARTLYVVYGYVCVVCWQDPRMMAFFDSLVQRELENWSSSDDSVDAASGLFGSQVYSPSSRSASPVLSDYSDSSTTDAPDVLIPLEVSVSFDSSYGDDLDSNRDNATLLNMDEHATRERLRHATIRHSESTSSTSQSISASASQNSTNESSNTDDTLTSASSESQLGDSEVSPGPGTSAATSGASTPLRRRVTVVRSEASTSTSSPRDSGISETSSHSDETRRTNISNLIKTKRKEYLEGIKKLELKAKRRRKLVQLYRAERVKRIQALQDNQLSSSDSSNSDADSSDNNDDDNASRFQESTDILRDIVADRRQRSEGVARLKMLRTRVLQDDGLDSGVPSTTAAAGKEEAQAKPLNLSNSSSNTSAIGSGVTKLSVDNGDNLSECECRKRKLCESDKARTAVGHCQEDCTATRTQKKDDDDFVNRKCSCEGSLNSSNAVGNRTVETNISSSPTTNGHDLKLGELFNFDTSNGHPKSCEAQSSAPEVLGATSSSANSLNQNTEESQTTDSSPLRHESTLFKKPKGRGRNYRKPSSQ